MSKTYISPEVIQEVLERSGGCCEVCSRTYQLQMAHKEAKGMGGIGHKDRAEQIDSARNIVHLCVFCHWWLSHGIVTHTGDNQYFNDPLLPLYEQKAREMGIWRRDYDHSPIDDPPHVVLQSVYSPRDTLCDAEIW